MSKTLTPSSKQTFFPLSNGRKITGTLINIRVTSVSSDESVPLNIREALVGLHVPTIFSKVDAGKELPQLPQGSRAAYVHEVVRVLRDACKNEVADALARLGPHHFDLYVFESDTFECT